MSKSKKSKTREDDKNKARVMLGVAHRVRALLGMRRCAFVVTWLFVFSILFDDLFSLYFSPKISKHEHASSGTV